MVKTVYKRELWYVSAKRSLFSHQNTQDLLLKQKFLSKVLMEYILLLILSLLNISVLFLWIKDA